MARPSWHVTRVTERLGLRYPIIQGPFGNGLSRAALVAAVTNAGGLGSFGLEGFEPAQFAGVSAEIRALTSGPFALNLWVPLKGEGSTPPGRAAFDRAVRRLDPIYVELGMLAPRWEQIAAIARPSFEERVEALIAVNPPVASFMYGIPPEPVLRELRARGSVVIGTATNVAEGIALERAGIDLVVASGSDAGGHRSSFLRPAEQSLTTSALVLQLAVVLNVPVIAAGGIVNGRSTAAALMLGAEAVQVGTAFLASNESGAPDAHKAALIAYDERSTVLTTAFTGRHSRGFVNQFVDEIGAVEEDILPYPWQYLLTRPIRAAAGQQGKTDWMSLWAGQNAPLVTRRSAAEVMRFLVEDTDQVIAS